MKQNLEKSPWMVSPLSKLCVVPIHFPLGHYIVILFNKWCVNIWWVTTSHRCQLSLNRLCGEAIEVCQWISSISNGFEDQFNW